MFPWCPSALALFRFREMPAGFKFITNLRHSVVCRLSHFPPLPARTPHFRRRPEDVLPPLTGTGAHATFGQGNQQHSPYSYKYTPKISGVMCV